LSHEIQSNQTDALFK